MKDTTKQAWGTVGRGALCVLKWLLIVFAAFISALFSLARKS